MNAALVPFRPEDFLSDPASQQAFLTDALQQPDQDYLLEALSVIARARGMPDIAAATGLSRESLYKALRAGSKPYFDTVRRVFEALGMKLVAAAI